MKIKSFLIVSVLAVAILGFGFVASAQTTDVQALIAQLQAQIQSLIQQIAQLRAQQGNAVAWCHTFNNYLVAGSTGTAQDVDDLQTALTKQGFNVSGDAVGTFGDDTAAAVVAFQGKYGIRQTGTVGPITRAKLNSLYRCGITPPTTCTPNWTCGWGPCTNGWQQKTAIDSNNCGIYSASAIANCTDLSKQACAPASTQPTVAITSPQNNSALTVGQVATISWSATGSGFDKYQIIVGNSVVNSYRQLYDAVSMVDYIPVYQTTFSWNVPNLLSDFTSGTGYSADQIKNSFYLQVKLIKNDSVGGSIVSTSNKLNFSVVGNTPQPTATLVPSDTFFNFNLTRGASTQPYNLHLTNASATPVNFTLSVPNQPTWLNSSYNTQPLSLNAWGTMGVGISVDTTKVSGAGTYTTNLVISGNFSNSPITIPITLTVTSQTSLPVSVVSPNGGETFAAGQTYQIKWNASGDPVSQNMQITLANSDTGELARIGSSCIEQGVVAPVPSNDPNARYLQANCSGLTMPVQNTGSYNWTIPASLPSGSHYYIYVGELKIMGDGDFSSAPFNIAAAPLPTISFTSPTTAQVGQPLTVNFSNGGNSGSVILKTTDGTKSWHIPYTTGTVYNGFVAYDGSKVSFTVPSTIGAGQLPENSGYEAPVPITTGTYNLFIYSTGFATGNPYPITITANQ